MLKQELGVLRAIVAVSQKEEGNCQHKFSGVTANGALADREDSRENVVWSPSVVLSSYCGPAVYTGTMSTSNFSVGISSPGKEQHVYRSTDGCVQGGIARCRRSVEFQILKISEKFVNVLTNSLMQETCMHAFTNMHTKFDN